MTQNNPQKVVTRFAPSPTGFLHIGGVRTALFSYLYAKQNNGKYVLRIEDTDRVRSTPEFEKDITDVPTNGTFVGLDRGISNIAVTSNNEFYTGKDVKRVSQHYRNLRRRLQRKGTKSAKRHLKKISGKERRFKADINHQVSKKIIENLHSEIGRASCRERV